MEYMIMLGMVVR